MDRIAQQFFRTAIIVAIGGLSPAAVNLAFAQAIVPEANRSVPQDWSHNYRIYTNPDTLNQAAGKGTLALEKWKQKVKDPRFAAQVARKTQFVQTTGKGAFSGQQLQWANRFRRDPVPATGADVHRDWSNVLGGATGVGKAGVFPAKFNFDINAAADCANDFLVFTTASSGATGSGALATRTGTFTAGTPTAGQTATITNGSRVLTLTASTTVNTGTNFLVSANTTTNATNLRDAINRNGGTVGVTATSAAAVVTVTAITHGTGGNSIALADSMSVFSWAGTALTGGSGTAGQPTIIAFNQLYSSCGTSSTPVPATFWAYNTGTAAFTETSPVLSLDGSQVAFVQRTGTTASLVVLKWSSTASVGTVGAPSTPASVMLANYRACTAPCMTATAFSGSPNDTNSSPYYDYTNDVLYVGADNGTLHKFTGVFNGTPAEVTTGGWPATVSSGNVLASPVYDSDSSLVFVGSASGTSTGGQLHSVDASGTVASSARLATNSSSGVRDAPIVDSAAQMVYAFVGSDLGVATAGSCSTIPCAAVFQFPTTDLTTSNKVRVGRGVTSTTTRFLYAGAFDDAYYNSASPASPSGRLYVCGGLAATASRPTLWKIPIANNVMGIPIPGPSLVTANADCSPVAEVMNGANEYLYAGVTAGGSGTCTGACVYMFPVPPALYSSFDTTSASSIINNTTARYINVSTSAALNTTETNVDTPLSAAQAGTYYGMTITQSAPSGTGTTFTYVLRSNAANTTVTCAIGPAAATCSDTTNTVALAAGALVDVRVVRSGTANNLTATFRVQLQAAEAVPAASAGLAATGGVSGIIIDNISSTAGASQVYYSTLTSPGNAIQASQAALQ